MSLAHRITKLEQKAWPLLRCFSCQLRVANGLRELRSGQKNSDTVLIKCLFCGGRYEIPLEGRSNEVREIVTLILEADPIQKYYDERWYCAKQWFVRRHSQIEIYQREMSSEDPFRFYHAYPPVSRFKENMNSSLPKRNTPIVNLQAKAAKFARDELLKVTRIIKAPKWFPIDETVEQIRTQVQDQKQRHIAELHCKLKLPYLQNLPQELEYTLNACFTHLETLKEREAYEVFIWRRSLEVTKTETVFFEQEVQNKSTEAIQALSFEDAKLAPAIVTELIHQDNRGHGSLENTQQTAPVRTNRSNVHVLMNESSGADCHDSMVTDQSLIVNLECESSESQPLEYRTIEDSSGRSKGYERFFSNSLYRRTQEQPRFIKQRHGVRYVKSM